MNEVSALQHDARGEAPLGALWQSVSGRSADFALEEQAARREIIARSFSAQLEACAASFHRARARRRRGDQPRGVAPRAGRAAGAFPGLSHLCARRTSVRQPTRAFLDAAAAGARRNLPRHRSRGVDRLPRGCAVRGDAAQPRSRRAPSRASSSSARRSPPRRSRTRPSIATAGCCRATMSASTSTRFGDGADGLSRRMRRRQRDFPHAMLATATHDHKRGEDVRARLAVLSEMPDEWAALLPRWIAQCAPLAHATALPACRRHRDAAADDRRRLAARSRHWRC